MSQFLISPFTQLYAQYWYRDPVDPDRVGLSDALLYVVCP